MGFKSINDFGLFCEFPYSNYSISFRLGLCWARDQQQNSQQNMWLPEPGMGNLAQASSHTEFHQLYRLVSQHRHFNLSALTRRKTLRKFYVWADKKMKHLKSFLRLQVSNTSSDESSACKQRLSRSIPPSVPGTPSAQHSTQACEAEQLQEAQAAHHLNTISSQGSKMIIDFILIGLSAMSQFKC